MERDSLGGLMNTDEESYSTSDEFDSDSSSTDGRRKEQLMEPYSNRIMDASSQRAGNLAGVISHSNGKAGSHDHPRTGTKDGARLAINSSNHLTDTVWDSPVVPPGSPINGNAAFKYSRTANAGASAR